MKLDLVLFYLLIENMENVVYLRSITHVQRLVGSNLFINSKQLNINYLESPKEKYFLIM